MMRRRHDYTTRLDRVILIQRPLPSDDFDGAGSGNWGNVAEVDAEVLDSLPSRGERQADGFTVSSRHARVRMRFREDVTQDMRFILDGRIMQIISGPAELGRREAVEFTVEEYRPAGNQA